jgi:hemerythrin
MSDAVWNAALVTGHDTMDAEHRAELDLLEALGVAVAERRGPDEVRRLLSQLTEHTTLHFLSEQLLMRLSAYPQYHAHADEHDRLIDQARVLQGHIDAGEVTLTLSFIDSMKRWLVDHMQGKDLALARFLEDQRAPGGATGSSAPAGKKEAPRKGP